MRYYILNKVLMQFKIIIHAGNYFIRTNRVVPVNEPDFILQKYTPDASPDASNCTEYFPRERDSLTNTDTSLPAISKIFNIVFTLLPPTSKLILVFILNGFG